MIAPVMKDCVSCAGSGQKPRERRKLAGGEADPLDILGRFPGTCDQCGGSGKVPENPPKRTERKGGYVADI